MVDGLMQEELTLELGEILDGITREVEQVKGVKEEVKEDERLKLLKDEN